ncbi:MAG: glycosyltransferase [Acidobacteria bacterium]|nr:glycosyltransferase [Acidobacteriota bacterium]
MTRRVLYVSYNSLIEPLGPTQILPYVLGLSELFDMSVLSYDKPVRTPEDDARDSATTAERLSAHGVAWIRLRYHRRPSVPATIFDIACGVWRVLREHRRRPFHLLHARGYVPAAIACAVKKCTGVPFLFDIRGLQAEEYVDAGLWDRTGVPYRLTKFVEQWILRDTDGINTLTEAVRPVLREFPGLRGRPTLPPWSVIPTCVDLDHFRFDVVARHKMRARLNVGDRPVLVYSGSIGTWYQLSEMLDFYVTARERWPGLFLLVLVNRSPAEVVTALEEREVSACDFDVRWAHHDEMPAYLSASDAAVAFIRPSLSKQSSAPTKYAEYLACGLPFAATSGVGDIDALLAGSGVGVLVTTHSQEAHKAAADQLRVLAESRDRAGCRTVAEREFSMVSRALPAYRELYAQMFRGAAV